MDIKTIDKAITDIIEKKIALSVLAYDHKDYDTIEEDLHDMEDDFIEKYGDHLEEILEKVHEDICPESDVLLPIAYLANKYIKTGKNADGTTSYDVDFNEGVWGEVEKYANRDTRLVIIPNPTRIVLLIDGKGKEIVWQAGEE